MPLHCSVLEGLSLNDVSAIIRGMTFKQRSDGRFEGRLTLNGKRKSFYGTTKAEVKNKAKRYLMQIENGFKDPKKITFEEYAEYWFLTYKKGRIEPSSYTRLYRVFDAQLRDKIGSQKVGTITTQQLQKIIDEYANPSNGTEALSLSGLSKITQFLKSCFKSALKEEIISFNPAEDVLLPSKSYIAKETKQQFSLSDEEIERFRVAALEKLTNIDDYKSRNALVLLLILNLGLRAGDDDDKIRLNQRKPSKYKGLRRFGPEKNLQRINKFMKERPIFYKNLIQMKENIRFYLRCFYCITKVMILQFNSENRTELARNG